jgi:mannose-binding lectin 2
VHGHGKDLFGDGFIMWYTKEKNQLGNWNVKVYLKVKLLIKLAFLGPVFGSKDYFHGLAIILDTYSNHNGPHNVRKKDTFVNK